MKPLPVSGNFDDHRPEGTHHPNFGEAFRFWLKLGFNSFGGPTGQIAIVHAELDEKKKWISEARFLHALNYCMLLPGPEAQQLATYVGWLLHDLARFDWRARGSSKYGSLPLAIYVQYAFIDALAELANEW